MSLPENPLDIDPLLAALVTNEVRFIVIGGFAALVHGSPFPTEDLDITPEGGADNLARLSAALTHLGARIRTQGVESGLALNHDPDSLAAVGVWNLTTPHGDLDVSFVPTGTTGFDDLVQDAKLATIRDVTIPVASLADVIRSKQAANRPKDQRVLPVLREILASRYQR